MATKKENDEALQFLARLDERTQNFAKSLDFLAAENRGMQKAMLAALEKHADDDTARFKEQKDGMDKHDGRIKVLENWRWYILGALALLSAISLIVIDILRN